MKKILGKVAKLFGGVVLTLVLAVVGYVVLRPKPPQPPETVTNITEVEAYLEELVEFGTPPGLSLVVVKDGAIVYSKGFGSSMRLYPEESLGLIVIANDTTYNPDLILDFFANLDW